jgi:hypothetical protein
LGGQLPAVNVIRGFPATVTNWPDPVIPTPKHHLELGQVPVTTFPTAVGNVVRLDATNGATPLVVASKTRVFFELSPTAVTTQSATNVAASDHLIARRARS